jgi:hypothetical protein
MSMSRAAWLVAVFAVTLTSVTWAADELAQSVAARLRDSGNLDGYRVRVRAKQGTVWLEGQVSESPQIAAAVGITEATPGVERVVNRLTVSDGDRSQGVTSQLDTPRSVLESAGLVQRSSKPARPSTIIPVANAAASDAQHDRAFWQATEDEPTRVVPVAGASGGRSPARMAAVPRPIAMASYGYGGAPAMVGDGQMVPGSMRVVDGPAMNGGMQGPPPGGMGPMVSGGPMPMGGAGMGMPPVPVRGGGPNLPNYAWPSYAASPNYAALQYPTQYSPTAWPYIGPFYPYPQVPLGWRRVSLEWDDGWWWLDFDERHIHSHHR